MLTLPHTLVAVALVKIFPDPYICLPLALLSHFFLDFFIPHWNPHLFTEFKKNGRISVKSIGFIIGDTALAISLCFYILLNFWPNFYQIAIFAAAIFLSTLPDTIEIPYYFLKSKSKYLAKYVKFEHQYQANASWVWGLLTQFLVSIFCLGLFLGFF